MKLSPVPVEYGRSTPLCEPLREPLTVTPETVVPLPPRKLICVLAEASGVPGWGETATGLALAAFASGGGPGTSADDALPHAISAAPQASAPSAGVEIRIIAFENTGRGVKERRARGGSSAGANAPRASSRIPAVAASAQRSAAPGVRAPPIA
jgi:hypothetical protein